MTPPIVLHVIPGLETGGAERMLTSVVTAKRNMQFSQYVVNLMKGGVFSEQIRDAGVPICELGLNSINLPAIVLQLALLIRRLSPAVIQTWLYYGDLIGTAALYLSGRRRETRLYWGIRCSDINQASYGARLRLSVGACVKLSRFTDAVIANSYAGRLHHQKIGYRPPAFLVIPNGIDTIQFQPNPALRTRVRAELNIPDTAVFVIHVARVDQMKDHGTFLKVAAAMPDIRFAVVGRGTESLQTTPNVMRLGVQRDMLAIYAAADFLISTSIFGEGFPNVVAEGMASGVPAIATDVGDARKIIGDTGFIVRPNCPTSIVDALTQLIEEPDDQRIRRAMLCRNRVITDFSLERAVACFDGLYLGTAANESQTI